MTRHNKWLHVKQGMRKTLGHEEGKRPSKDVVKSHKEKEVKPECSHFLDLLAWN
jgi:hypothetical protein